MVFSSHIFVYYFLPLALFVYYVFGGSCFRRRNLLMTVLGYLFYGWANPKFIFLLFATTLFDWLLSQVIVCDSWRFWRVWGKDDALLPAGSVRSRNQRTAVTLSVISNLLVLGFFKYFNFGVESYNNIMQHAGLETLQWESGFRVILPLGISFYTFQSLSYVIDVYRGEAPATRRFGDFACFVSMFPHLVAGPILKYSILAAQLKERSHTINKFVCGVAFFGIGMAKKILLANPCGAIADTAFKAGSLHMLDAWYGVTAFAFQIYFDFSGYSDMAMGLGLMFGFVLVRNFNNPYRSESITEFWQRWHISLSSWLRNYLYIPLGGNRAGNSRTYFNLMLTMFLGGLWHGASWTFVVWGIIHGSVLVVERINERKGWYWRAPRAMRVVLTFVIVLVGWVFFKATDIHHALMYLSCMSGWVDWLGRVGDGAGLLPGIMYSPYYSFCFIAAGVFVWVVPDTWEFLNRLTWRKAVFCIIALAVALIVMRAQDYNPFIYYIF